MGRPRNGLSAYDGQAWTTYTTDDGMASNRLTAVAVAGGDTVWVGTQQRGLSRLDEGEWTTFTADDGLASDRIRALAVAPDGAVWADAGGAIGTGANPPCSTVGLAWRVSRPSFRLQHSRRESSGGIVYSQ